MWDMAENKLREVLDELGIKYYEAKGEAAFYGPKLDVQVKSAIGHDVTLSTCQLDFLLPERFNLEYIDKDGSKARPVVIHRAILGSLDRFIAFLLEETKGVLPLFIAYIRPLIAGVLLSSLPLLPRIYFIVLLSRKPAYSQSWPFLTFTKNTLSLVLQRVT